MSFDRTTRCRCSLPPMILTVKVYGQGNVLLFLKRETIGRGVPHHYDAVSRGRLFLEKIDEEGELVSSEMLAPSVAIGDSHDVVRVGEDIPDLGVFAEEVIRLAAAHDEPRLLGDEYLDGDLAQ